MYGKIIFVVMKRCILRDPKKAASHTHNQTVFRTLWRVHRSWFPCHPSRIQNTRISRESIWKVTPAQHFACFQGQFRSLGVSDQHYTLHGLRGGGATDHWLQSRDLPLTTQRSLRTLERYIQEGPAPHGNCGWSQCSRRSRTSCLCRARLRKAPPPAPTATTLQRRGWRSPLQSAQRRRHQSFAHSVSPLGALPIVILDEKQGTRRRGTRYGRGHTGMDHVASCVRRSRLGAAFQIDLSTGGAVGSGLGSKTDARVG